MKKRLLAWLLSLSLVTGLLPVSAFAAEPPSQPLNGDDSQMEVEQSTVTVDYGTSDRSTATITYHKEGIEADPFNLIFLVDTSRQGAQSHAVFEQMMNDNGTSYIYDYSAASTVQLITYQNTASSTGIMDTKDSFMEKFGDHGVGGEGTANEPVALETAIKAVQDAHAANDYPTVVFWVLGGQFGTTDTNAIEEKLKSLDAELTDDTDALITWQYAAQPSELLKQYATQHAEAHDDSGQEYPAAHAANDSVLMQEEMAADLEEIVHDHYHNISFSLLLDDGQTLVKSIKNAWYEAGSSMASITATPREDGRGLDVTIDRLCRQIEVDFIIEVELDTNIYEKQTVIPAGKIVADHNGDNGGLHTGLFDEQIEYGLELDLPSVELDRTAHDITFQNADGVSDITNKLTGETITLPQGDGLTQDGSSFGGWNVVSGANLGRHYAPGEIISMPSGDMTLEPTFGHVEVELEIDYDQGEAPVYGNQMREKLYENDPLNFDGVTLPDNGGTITNDNIVSISFIDFLPEYDTIDDANDPDRVKLTNVKDAVYARHVGQAITDKVVAYLVSNKTQSGKYDLYVAGSDGVKAPSSGLSFEQFSSCKSISLMELDTTGVAGISFYNCKALTSITFGGKFDTSSMTSMSNMFYRCSSLTSLDLSSFDTSSVQSMSFMFDGCTRLTSLDLSSFDTSAVTDMSYMFRSCTSLRSVKFGSEWDTSNVQNMNYMFTSCTSLTDLDVSGFDTSGISYYLGGMFYECSSLTSLDLSSFDTSSVHDMYQMFYGCSSLQSLTLGDGWDTSSVEEMSYMFYNCSKLKELDVSKFSTSKVKNMAYMFAFCNILTDLPFGENFDTSNVTNMSSMFYGCNRLKNLDVSKFDTSNVTNMSYMFHGCSDLPSLSFGEKWNTSNVTSMHGMFEMCTTLTSLDLSRFDTSNVTGMSTMFCECYNLENLNLGNSFDISKVTNLSDMFYGCYRLKTLTGSIKLGESNATSSFSGLFSGLYQLPSITFDTPENGAAFPNLSTMENMFKNCSSLESIDLGNWSLPNLTNTDSMFSDCSSLTSIDLTWSDIKATEGNYTINNMFRNVSSSATLESGSDNSVMLNAIRKAFPGSVTQDGAQWTAPANQLITETTPAEVPEATPEETPDEAPQTPEETPDEPQSNSSETPEDSQLTPNETPEVSQPTQDETPEVSQPAQDEAPQTPDTAEDAAADATPPQNTEATEPSDEGTEPTDEPSVMPLSTTETALARSATTYASGEESVYVHPEMVSEFDTITYKVTVKYVGDVGVKSGRITLNFPIPEDIGQFQGTADSGYADAGWNISTTQIDYSGSPTGYKGGRVVEEPTVKEVGSGQYALQGVFEGLYTGTEVTVSIITTVQGKQDEDYNDAGYAFWDGTAYVTDSAGTSASQTVRLWNLKDGEPTPPTTTSYQLRYAFTGDVPSDAELPQTTVVDSGTKTNAAAKPTEPEGYTFDGWYRSDNGTKVTPGTEFSMPAANLTLTGKWTLDDAHIQKITVKYEYTNNNDGAHIPDGAPVLPEDQTVKVGQTHYIQKIDQDADYHKFGGWEPTLSVNGHDVPLTKQPDGTYQSNDKAYTIDVAGGTLSTDQFRDKNNVVVTFSGAWTPYKGTIRFDANGGEGDMDDMTNVTWDTTKTLTKNAFTYPYDGYQFIGWATTPAGAVFKTDQQTAEGLINEDGKTVTLYAVWKRAAYGVGYSLNHVTSSSTDTTVTLGGSYSTTLTADEGYEMSDVSITMGGVVITSQAYNEATGEVSISNINGNIIIKAEAKPKTAVTEHMITVSVTNGTATPSGTVQVQDGQSQTITFAPNAGYVLDSVTVDGNPAELTGNSYTFVNVTANHSIAVVYKNDGSGGSGGGGGGGTATDKYPIHVEDTGNGTAASDKQEAAAGEDVTIDTDGEIIDITVADKNGNEVPITDNGDGSFTFEMPNSEVTVKVDFEPLPDVADPNDTGVADWLNTSDHVSYLSGYPDGSFKPGNNMTRAEVAQMFYNLLLDKDVAITVSFKDVKQDSWYATAVHTLASLGIITGIGNDQFAPERAITRAEFTAIAMRFATLDTTGINIFSDVTENDWFYDYVVGSIQYGWITGYEDGTFRPNHTISRAEVTTITNRMLGRSADESYVNDHSSELKSFTDVTNAHWAYYQIVEATNSHDFEKTDGSETWNNIK